jgi:hypothetical protein
LRERGKGEPIRTKGQTLWYSRCSIIPLQYVLENKRYRKRWEETYKRSGEWDVGDGKEKVIYRTVGCVRKGEKKKVGEEGKREEEGKHSEGERSSKRRREMRWEKVEREGREMGKWEGKGQGEQYRK